MKTKSKPKNKILAVNQKNAATEPNSKNNYAILLSISFVIIAFVISALFYNSLPNTMITHWGLAGEANGYTLKETGLFMLPLLMTGIIILLYFIPKLDPLRRNVDGFKKEYHLFIAVMAGFFLYLQLIIIAINLGMNFDIRQLLAPAFAVLIYSIGILIKKAKRNFFIGIKTPWTLNSDAVWDKTHAKAGKLFKASAILSLIGFFIPELAFFFMLVPIVLASIWVIIYSYIEYKKENKQQKN